MKETLIALCAILAVSRASVIITAGEPYPPHLLGSKECTWGPSYWCTNITTSAACQATKHCIKTQWEKLEVPEDYDSICTICKDMVEQARNQLESNQTQNDLKLVFEGSCILIRIKPIVKECINLVDQFVPELIETLASQMNPSVVCSVAGLCNSPRMDHLLAKYKKLETEVKDIKSMSLKNDELEPDECSKCFTVATHMENKLVNTPNNEVAKQMITACGEMGSFSDACASIVLSNFDTIYDHLRENFKAKNICHLSGQCSARFHQHENNKPLNVDVRPLSSVGMVEIGDDLPCKLCEQLVGHLRDLLVANTTEAEFQQVLEGLCKQTKSFSKQCKAIVDEYYPEIYSYLTKELNANAVCEMSGMCPAPDKLESVPIWPLLPKQQVQLGVRILKKDDGDNANKPRKNLEAEEMQLPLERMMLPSIAMAPQMDAKGQNTCAFCEYLLHYIQQVVTNPTVDQNIKQVLEKICKKLPNSVENTCNEFVDNYGDAVVAILAQQIDPSQLCPMIHVCPADEFMMMWGKLPKDMMLKTEVQIKPSCPLCLLAVSQLYSVVQNDKTEANIQAQLKKLCVHLPASLADQCVDLVKGYSKEIIELVIADLTPQEVCNFIKLCDDSKDPGPRMIEFPTDKDGEIMTNEIPNFPINQVNEKPVQDDPECYICKVVMNYLEKEIRQKKTKDEIESLVHSVCNHLPHNMSRKCNDFVNKYADIVIELISSEISPKQLCGMISLCSASIKQLEESVAECALCQYVISEVDKLLTKTLVDHDIEEALSKVCKHLSSDKYNKCVMMVKVYGPSIINLFREYGNTRLICSKISLCSANDYFAMKMKRNRRSENTSFGTKPCTWGHTYWCLTDENANECKAVEHCRQYVWKAESAAAAAAKQDKTPIDMQTLK